jgi:dynein heavy chain 1, cytosolic
MPTVTSQYPGSVPDAQKILQKLADMLTKIQKALGDYLEAQRSNFARFYFIGDEDLLEIIGNSRNIGAVGRHLGKMFAGLCLLGCGEKVENGQKMVDDDLIIRMMSREGEHVSFAGMPGTPAAAKGGWCVRISENPSIHAWLSRVETAMCESLANQLESAIESTPNVPLKGEMPEDTQKEFLKWVGMYACQVLLIGCQISWTNTTKNILEKGGTCAPVEAASIAQLGFFAKSILDASIPKTIKTKLGQLITELVHQRDVSRNLMELGVNTWPRSGHWGIYKEFDRNFTGISQNMHGRLIFTL